MLVDINLLPKREPRNAAAFIIIIGMITLLLSGAIYFYWQLTVVKQTTSHVENEIDITTEILAIEQSKLGQSQTMNQVEQLEKAIDWTKDEQVDVNYMMQQLFKLLPERGFVQSFHLTNETVTSTIQFDSSADAAYYLHLLLGTSWIADATLSDRTVRDVADFEADEADDILPRYVADYTIQIDVDAVKEQTADRGERP